MEIPVKTEITMDRDARQTVSAVAVLACAWPALLLATVCLLPFLNKPFVIDDPWFMTMAQQIVKHPAHPMDFAICWNSPWTFGECWKASQFASGNPMLGQVGQGYVLVPAVLGGCHEWMAHLTQLVLVWIAVVAMTSLIFRFGWNRWHAIAGALLLVAIPPFLPMASTAMPDILATALALIGMERLAAWKAEHKWGQGAAAAIALGLAGFARPHLVLLLPLAAFFLLENTNPRVILGQIRRELRLWTPVLAGSCLLLAIIFAFREHNLAISPPTVGSGAQHIRNNLYAFLLYFAFPLPLAVCWIANRLKAGRLRIVLVLFAMAVVPCLFRWNLALILFFVVIGFGVLADLLFEAVNSRDPIGVFLMLWILIPLPIVYYAHLPMKYLLPCIPAVILLCFRLLDGVSAQFARAIALVLVVAGTGYSLLILHADVELADFGRDALYGLISPQVAIGKRVWYPGQYWSYWYAPLDGATLTYLGGPQPKSGDLLVVNNLADGDFSPLKRFPHRTLVEAVSHKYRFGRTVGAGIGGLYSGFWLWGLGNRVDDSYELWRID